MATEAGEFIVGAYLQHVHGCDVVQYNVRLPGGGLQGLPELDVLGLNLAEKTAYLCEVTTHIRGVLYKNYDFTVAKIRAKHESQRKYAAKRLKGFTVRCMFWSPVVPRGALTEQLEKIHGLELMINGSFKRAVDRLREIAASTTHATGNPFMRTLQILEHLRDD